MIGVVIEGNGWSADALRARMLAEHAIQHIRGRGGGSVALVDSLSVREERIEAASVLDWHEIKGGELLDPFDSGSLDRVRLRAAIQASPATEVLCLDFRTFWIELIEEVVREFADALFVQRRSFSAVVLVCDDFVSARAVELMLARFWLPTDVHADKTVAGAAFKSRLLGRTLRYLGDGVAYRVLFKIAAGLKGWIDRLRA